MLVDLPRVVSSELRLQDLFPDQRSRRAAAHAEAQDSPEGGRVPPFTPRELSIGFPRVQRQG